MSDFEALKEVLERRLHNTRDPELQALLWQMGEYADEMRALWLMSHRTISDIYRRINTYGIQATTPIEGRPDGNSAGGDREDRLETQDTDGSV